MAIVDMASGLPLPPQQPQQINAEDVVKKLIDFQRQTIMPASLPPTLAPINYQPSRPIGSFGSVGERERADRQSVISGIAQTVQKFSDLEQQKKTRHMEALTTRLTSAMQGYQEAQSNGDQAALKANADIVNDIMTDPKNVKALQKALDINLLGDSKHKNSPEQRGFLAAMQKNAQAQKTGQTQLNPLAQLLMSKMPVRAGLSPTAAAQEAAVKAGLVPNANELLKSQTKLQEEQAKLAGIFTQVQAKGASDASREEIAKMLVDAKDNASKASIAKQTIANLGRIEAAKIFAQASKYKADKAYDAITERTKIMQEKIKADKSLAKNDPTVVYSGMIDKQVQGLKAQLDAAKKSGDESVIAAVSQKLDRLNKVQQAVANEYAQKTGAVNTDKVNEITGSPSPTDLNDSQMDELEKLLLSDDNSSGNSSN